MIVEAELERLALGVDSAFELGDALIPRLFPARRMLRRDVTKTCSQPGVRD